MYVVRLFFSLFFDSLTRVRIIHAYFRVESVFFLFSPNVSHPRYCLQPPSFCPRASFRLLLLRRS
ncbi:hypothetical protein BDZ97DRAFT_1814936 [Flammula alnicola]|nr:hypothetical protein BDZ97DRAFT_1814936 [Flammula alnicola]